MMKQLRLKWGLIGFTFIVASVMSASYLNGGWSTQQEKTIETFTNSIGMRLVHLPSGTFKMGHPKLEPPVHEVSLSPFWIGRYEVTNAEYEQFKKRPRPIESPADQQPVTRISWSDATMFCEWLSKKEGRRYRLPTEAEWEYAARGGLEQKEYPWGNASPRGRATYGVLETTPVGTHAPNGYGLYDMAGNVGEWVSDWYAPYYYSRSPTINPKGPATGEFKIKRGGDFAIYELSSSFRILSSLSITTMSDFSKFQDIEQMDGSGFRVVMEDKEESKTK